MSQSIIWLHDEALRAAHPVFSVAPEHAKAIFIWDENYFKQLGYSLKRLVFIYETLCDLPVEIFQGDTLNLLKQFLPSVVYIPESYSCFVQTIARELSAVTKVQMVDDEPFVVLSKKSDCKRFFQYWNKAEKLALLKDGKKHA